jgi:hypothetical protein
VTSEFYAVTGLASSNTGPTHRAIPKPSIGRMRKGGSRESEHDQRAERGLPARADQVKRQSSHARIKGDQTDVCVQQLIDRCVEESGQGRDSTLVRPASQMV